FCRGGESTISERLTRPTLAFGHEQFGCCGVIERHGFQPSIEVTALSDAIKLAFFGHPLVRLRGTFDLVLEVIAFGRQQLRDLIDAARTARAEQPRRVIYRLANLELVAGHGMLLVLIDRIRRPAAAPEHLPLLQHSASYTKSSVGPNRVVWNCGLVACYFPVTIRSVTRFTPGICHRRMRMPRRILGRSVCA